MSGLGGDTSGGAFSQAKGMRTERERERERERKRESVCVSEKERTHKRHTKRE